VKRAAVLAAGLLTAGCAATVDRGTAYAPLSGYLDAAAVQAVSAGVTPRPVDPAAEQAVFAAVEPGSDRWQLAIVHAELRPPEAAQHFDCVLGTRLAQQPRPALTRLMTRLLIDSAGVTSVLAERAPRSRPIVDRPDLEPCVRMDDAARNSPSWPASGAVVGAAYGEMFAALAPNRAEAARRRGLDIGLSRAVCRVNWQADVADGAEIGRAVYARAAAASGFAADLEAARSDLADARAEGLTNPGCAAERRALRQTGA
jgi:acid phosphatase (class A)